MEEFALVLLLLNGATDGAAAADVGDELGLCLANAGAAVLPPPLVDDDEELVCESGSAT